MTDLEKIEENDLLDFDDLFTDFVPDDILFLDDHVDNGRTPNSLPPPPPPSDNAAAASSFSIGDIENLLLSDDFGTAAAVVHEENDAFLSDLLVNSPQNLDPTSDDSSSSAVAAANVSPLPLVETSDSKDTSPSDSVEKDDDLHQQQGYKDMKDDGGDDNHPDVKKRKRQLRNRDAAVRSRERKKMYVKDLEMKSRYYESECRRLEWVLQCLRAENHALQFSLHTNRQAFGTSTRQESAVLLLESLLLGSLLWLMGIIGLLVLLPKQLLEAATHLENAEERSPAPARAPPRKIKIKSPAPAPAPPRKIKMVVNDLFGMKMMIQSFMKGKRWRGSKTRMKKVFSHPTPMRARLQVKLVWFLCIEKHGENHESRRGGGVYFAY